MRHFDQIYMDAADDYGIFRAADAAALGITGVELSRWVRSGRLRRLAHGVYRLSMQQPTDLDRYAVACATVSPDAVLYGTAVLAMHQLAFVNPAKVTVALSRRYRGRVPDWVEVVDERVPAPTWYSGIPSQAVADALVACKGLVMDDRLLQAAEEAFDRELIDSVELEAVRRKIRDDRAG